LTIAPLYGISNNKEWYLCPIFRLLEMVLILEECGKHGKLAVTAHIAAGHGLSGFAGI
jgi:hypothetical protein